MCIRDSNISINVFGSEIPLPEEESNIPIRSDSDEKTDNTKEEGIIYPLKITTEEISGRHVNLLMTENDDDDGGFHYSAITNFSALVSKQYNKNTIKNFIVTLAFTVLRRKKEKRPEKIVCYYKSIESIVRL